MRFLDLFAGVGGFSLGLERAGMTCVGQVEIDPFCCSVLERHWPHVRRMRDVREVKGDEFGPVELVCGGFPCQDISDAHTATRRRALSGSRSGLWSEFARILSAARPRFALIENVDAWRRWLPDVRRDLHGIGYAAVPIRVRASDLGARHQRPRVFVVAHTDTQGQPLRALHAEVARLRSDARRARSAWREPFAGPVRASHGIPDELDRVRALGNAVVPQIAELLGRAILSVNP